MLGGEESGGYAFRGNVPERDGILGNLYMLDFMVKTGKKPSELLAYLFSKVGAHYYDRIDTRCTPAERDAVNRSGAQRRSRRPSAGCRSPVSIRPMASSS